MKKIITLIAVMLMVCGFMSTGVSQDAEKCFDPENLSPLFGTKWEFTVEKNDFSFTDTLVFGTEKDVYLHPCPELFCFIEGYGKGSVHYGELPDGNIGFSAELTHNSFDSNPRYLFMISGDNAAGAYIGEDGVYYPMKGVRVYPENEGTESRSAEAKSLGLEIEGYSSVNEKYSVGYYYKAKYIGVDVTGSTDWTVTLGSNYAYFPSKGKLVTKGVPSDVIITIKASYLWGASNTTKQVTIKNIDGTVYGYVKNSSSNTAISGATVTVGGMTGTTNYYGYFSVSEVSAGSQTLKVSKTGCYAASKSVYVTANQLLNAGTIYLTCGNSGTVYGYVKDSVTYAAVSGATVTVGGKTGTTGSSGYFSVTGVSAGYQNLTVSKTGYSGASKSVSVISGQSANAGTIYITPQQTGCTVYGYVKDSVSYAAISGATVTVGGKTGTTNSYGYFSITGVSAGYQTLTVSKTGCTSASKSFSVTAGLSTNAGTIYLTCTGGNTPIPPTGVSATDGTYTDKVRVTWNTSSGAVLYQVWRGTSSSSYYATSLSSWQTGTTYDDTSAVAGTTYYYWVKAAALNAVGTASGFSSPDTGYKGSGTATATLKVTNYASVTQQIYLDNVYIGYVSGSQTKTWSITAGYHTVKMCDIGGINWENPIQSNVIAGGTWEVMHW